MTIYQLRNLFNRDTEIWLARETTGDRFLITNILFGTSSFAQLVINSDHVKADGVNKITVFTDMPKEVFEAWKKHSEY